MIVFFKRAIRFCFLVSGLVRLREFPYIIEQVIFLMIIHVMPFSLLSALKQGVVCQSYTFGHQSIHYRAARIAPKTSKNTVALGL